MNKRKTKVVKVLYGRRWFSAGMAVLMFCLFLFSTDAGAVYSIFETGSSDVWGLSDSPLAVNGSDFGTVSAIADNYDAYGLFGDGGDVTISGDFGTAGLIFARSGSYDAYGLYSDDGSITTAAINGSIVATAGWYRAVGLFSESGSITTGDIGGTITAEAWGSSAFGLRCDNSEGSIVTGDITGTISAIAGGDRAYGIRSDGSLTTGDIDGTITAMATRANTANGDEAYGLSSDGSLTTGDINGKISASADGSYAYGLYSGSDMIIDGNIGSTADINATAGDSYAFGLSADSIDINDIHGSISATATAGSNAYGLYASSELTVDNIGNDAEITATAGDSYAFGLFNSSPSSIIIGDINGTITATAITGSGAYGLYSSGDITIGNINSPAHITATAGADDAYGLCSTGGSITITGEINGTITATAGGDEIGSAYGLYADDSITIGAINGSISAEMTTGSDAYGLYAGEDITVNGNIGYDAEISATAGTNNAYGMAASSILINGDIDGTITAWAGDSNASGMSAGSITTGAINGMISATAETGSNATGIGASTLTTGAINGEISAWAGTSYARGLWGGGPLQTGAINGSITATADDGSYAYGLYTDTGSLTTGNIGYDAEITATAANGDYAFGLFSKGDLTTGAINGTISATAGDYKAAGLESDGELLQTGAINGTITATAGQHAFGLLAYNGDIQTGAINGNITAIANGEETGDRAYGLRAFDGSIATGDIEGTITATAGANLAAGMRSYGNITTGYIDGDITASAGTGDAYGLRSDNGVINIEEIYGNITATAHNGDNAYGIYAGSDLIVGDIGGTITAKASGNNAVGLFSGATEDSLFTGDISGTIDANAGGDFAYGILSYSPMDVTVDGGTISAVANGGTHFAAIQSGEISGGALLTQEADDYVEIVAGSTIVGDINLANNGTDSDLLTLSGDVSNSTTLDYDILNVETINITDGRWVIDGTVSNNLNGITMTGGILNGTGTLEDLDVIGGTFAPGHSVGTINIAGDLTLGEDSVYEVEVNEGAVGDLASVTGTATLEDGTIHAVALNWPLLHRDYNTPFEVNVIEAAGGVSGEFATITGGTAFLLFDVAYEANDVVLSVDQITDFAHYATTENQHSVGEAFNYLDPIVTTGDMRDVIDDILNLPDGAAVNRAYDQMMPQDALGLPDVTRNMMNQYSGGVLDHMDNVRGGKQYAMLSGSRYLLASADNALAAPPETDKWTPFAKGFGTWGDRDKNDDVSGYNFGTYGIAAGMDKLVSENTLFGFGIGGSIASVAYSQHDTSADIDSLLFSLYGSYFKDDWHVGLALGYGHNWYKSQRGIRFDSIDREAKSEHQGNSYSAAVEIGNNFGGTSMLLEPVAGIGYTSVSERGYTEHGADSLDLKVDSETLDGIYSKLGLRLAKEYRSEQNPDIRWVPKANAFWIHDFADSAKLDSSFVGGGTFTTEGLEPLRDVFNLGAGLNILFGKNTQLFVDYDWQTAGDFNANLVQAGMQWSF